MAGANAQSYVTPITAYNNTGLTANLGATTIYTIPAGLSGLYRLHFYLRVTTAGATSSTLPNANVIFTSGGVTITTGTSTGTTNVTATSAGNTTTTSQEGSVAVQCDASTNIQVQTTNFAANAAMTYELRVRVEYLG